MRRLLKNNLVYSLRQINFGLRIFFKNVNPKGYFKIMVFLWKRSVLRRPVPFSVVFALTYKCQCGCVHCSVNDYKRQPEDLSNDEVKKVIDFIDSWGPVKITFFGGEPLLRSDIVDLVKYASLKGIRVSIDTNGVLLDQGMVMALKRSGVGNINVSIDSSVENTHDSLRNMKGVFKKAVAGLNLCVENKIPCLISTYASNRSIREKDLEAVIKLGRELGVNGVKILFPILSGKWRESDAERLDPAGEAYLNGLLDPSFVYIEDALEMVKKRGKGCSAVERNLIYISPYGDVQPCPAIPVSFGNLRRQDLSAIIEKMSGHAFFKTHKSCGGCLMNENKFREKYFIAKNSGGLPIDVEEFS